MHDPLDAIRRLYGEPGAPPPDAAPPAAEAELAAMADLKKALDGLPPRSPDADLIDAVVAAARDAAAPAGLAAVRSVYGEAVELDAAADAEARALGPLKEALDALPPRRPPAQLVDAVVRAATVGETRPDDVLAPIRSVYGDEPAPLVAAEAEAAALGALKKALDALPPRRPDPSLVEAVVASAVRASRLAPAVAPAPRAADRPARRFPRRRTAAALATAFALVLVFGSGLWLRSDTAPEGLAQTEAAAPAPDRADSPAPDLVAQAEPAPPAEADADAPARPVAPPVEGDLVAAAEPAPARSAAPSAAAPVGTASAVATQPEAAPAPLSEALSVEAFADDAVLAADAFAGRVGAPLGDTADSAAVQLAVERALDDDDALRVMYLRLREMQAAQAGLGWDDTPVSLGAAPDSTPPAAGWMQVRVQR